MSKIVRNYIYNAAYQILVLLVPIITAPYLSRTLGASNLGIYSFVNSSGSIITSLSLLGIYAYGNRQTAYVRDNRDELTRTFWELMFTRLILGVIGTTIYVVYILFNRNFSFYFLIYYPFILAQFIDCSWVYVGLEDMRPAVMKNFVSKVANVIGIFLFVRKKEDVWIYILLLAMTALLSNMSIYFQLPKYIDRRKGGHRELLTNMLHHIKGSVFLFLPQAALLLYLQIDKIMIKWLTGTTSQVSFYDQAEKIIYIPLTLITVMSTVMMPRIANEFKKNNRQVIQALLTKAGKVTLFMAFPLMAGLFTVSRQFIPWYLGDEFISSAYAMMILAPIVVFNSLSGISGVQYFTATNQINALMKSNGSAVITNIIINLILIPKYGYLGAAVATVFSSLILVWIQYYILNRQMNIKTLLKPGFRYFTVSAVMVAAIYIPTRKMAAHPVTTLLQVMIGASVYFLILFCVKDDTIIECLTIVKSKFIRNNG